MLFNIYCLPLSSIITQYNVTYHLYADDTQLYVEFSDDNKELALSTLHSCIDGIKQWLSSNYLLLNSNKTEVVEFSHNRVTASSSVTVGDSEISATSSATNLGCVLDSDLNMSSHASKICKSANYHLYCIRKIRDCLPMETCKLLVHVLVVSRLDYGNALLCGARDDVIKQLERVQRLAARVVCKRYTNDHSSITELLWGLHWLPIRSRIQYKILVLVYKAFTTGVPSYLADLLHPRKHQRSTRSAQKVNMLEVPFHGGNRYQDKAFSVVGPKLWNELLNDDLRGCTNIETFKKKLKTFLFKISY